MKNSLSLVALRGFELNSRLSELHLTKVRAEPATMLLLGTGLVGLAGIRRNWLATK